MYRYRIQINTKLFLKLLITFFVSCLFFSSCVSTKQITYFQGDTARVVQLNYITPVIPTIQLNDLLAVNVSSLNQESNLIVNFPNISFITLSAFPGQISNSTHQPIGILVDSTGMIEMAFIGKVKVVNLTVNEAAEKIKIELNKYLKDPSVNVRFLNHKYSFLGEVNKPGIYNLIDYKMTLPEALSIAGDVTSYGQRNKVMVIRENNGIKEITHLNLLTREIFNSPYYYVRNGDLIYIEPSSTKAISNDRAIQLIPIISAITSTFVLLFTLLKK